MIFGGFFLNNNTVPVYFIWLKYLSWLGYGNEILLINQWDGISGIACPANRTSCITEGSEVITNFGMKKVRVVHFSG
jgi:hypothetical protein